MCTVNDPERVDVGLDIIVIGVEGLDDLGNTLWCMLILKYAL